MVSILLVNLKILYKKYGLLGLRGWWVKSKIIADGSINKALEGQHDSRGSRLHKLLKLLFASNANHWRKIFNWISSTKWRN